MVEVTISQKTRICRKCRETKDLSEYALMARRGWKKANTCRKCIQARQKEWVENRRATFDVRSIDMHQLVSCPRCKNHKEASLFTLATARKNGLSIWCKDCIKAYDRERYKENPQKKLESAKWYQVKSKFGLTRDQWSEKFKSQDGKCPICFRNMAELPLTLQDKRGACVDHDHKTGKVRDLLCSRCNQGIGLLGDNAELLERAALYLRRHSDG